MKKFLFVLTLSGLLIINSSFANTPVISANVIHSFEHNYKNADNVKWSEIKNMIKAEFTLEGRGAAIYYNEDGDLIAMTKYMSTLELPAKLQQNLQPKMKGYWVSDVFQLIANGEITYYITLENNEVKIVYQSFADKKWVITQKNSKS